MSRCTTCNGQMKPVTTHLTRVRDGHQIEITSVPADRCTRCGEEWFSSRVIKSIDRMIEERQGSPQIDYSAERLGLEKLWHLPSEVVPEHREDRATVGDLPSLTRRIVAYCG